LWNFFPALTANRLLGTVVRGNAGGGHICNKSARAEFGVNDKKNCYPSEKYTQKNSDFTVFLGLILDKTGSVCVIVQKSIGCQFIINAALTTLE